MTMALRLGLALDVYARGGGGAASGADAELEGETQGFVFVGTEDGVLVSVKDTTTPANNRSNVDINAVTSPITQSGTSPKLVLGADGLYHWSPHNLLPYSEALDNAFWNVFGGDLPAMTSVVGPTGATITANRFTWDGAGAEYRIGGGVGIIAGATYTLSLWHKSADGANHTFAIADQFASTVASTSVWQRKTITVVLAGGSVTPGFEFRPAYGADATGDVYIWGAQLNRGSEATAYMATTSVQRFGVPIEYDPVRAEYYVLSEPQATNLLLASQALDDAAVAKTVGTVSANAVVAPDGTLTGDTFTATGGPGTGFARLGTPTAAAHTYSMYVKAGTASWVALIPAVATSVVGYWAWFNVAAGVVGTKEAFVTSSAIQSVGNGWYRCSMTYTAGASADGFYLRMATADLDTGGAVGLTAHFWGAQLELGTYATSPVPTFAATVTRAGDLILAPITSFPLSSTIGTWASMFTLPTLAGGAGRMVGNSVGYQTPMYYTGANMGFYDGTAAESALVPISVSPAVQKYAMAYSGATAAGSLNAGAVGSIFFDGNFEFTGNMAFGSDAFATPVFYFKGRLYSVKYLPRRMTNAELQTETLLSDGGGQLILLGESAGLGIDFTTTDGLGSVAVKGHTTNLDNVPVDQFLTQSGTSPKLVMGADGLYHWTPHNLILQSQTHDSSPTWQPQGSGLIAANVATAPDGTLTADSVSCVGFSGAPCNFQAITTIDGATYSASVYFKANSAAPFAWMQINSGPSANTFSFNLTTGAVGSIVVIAGPGLVNAVGSIVDAGNGWFRCSATFVAGVAISIFFGPSDADGGRHATDGSIYAWGAQINRGSEALAYHATTAAAWFGVPIEYGGGGYYALVEPQATNLLVASGNFTNAAWVAFGVAPVTANAAVAPDGTMTASEVTFGAIVGASDIGFISQDVVSASSIKTGSVFLKAKTAADVGKVIFFYVGEGVDLVTHVLTASWARVATLGATATTNPSFVLAVFGSAYGGAVQGAATAYVWGAQLELGSVATSPIPTGAATVTRAMDLVNAPISTFPIGTAYTEYVDFTFSSEASEQTITAFMAPGTTDLAMLRIHGGPQIDQVVIAGSVSTVEQFAALTTNARAQVSARFAANSFALTGNGGALVSDVTGTAPTAPPMTRFDFGSAGASHNLIQGPVKLRRFVIAARAISDAELPTWRYTP